MGKSAIYVQYTRPGLFPPLDRSAALFARRGWSVLFLGIEIDGAVNRLAIVGRRGIVEELMPKARHGWRRKIHYAKYFLWCVRKILIARPAVVYCSDGWSYPLGFLCSFIPGIKTVLHEHDPPALAGGAVNKAVGIARRAFARRATMCVIPQDERAEMFRRQTGALRVQVAYNCPLRDEIVATDSREREHDGLTLWYHGSLGPSRLPRTIVQALAQLPASVRLRFAGYETVSHPHYIRELLETAGQMGLSARVEYMGAISRPDLYTAARTADVGMALLTDDYPDPIVGASNKPFDYLACGLPLLVNNTAEWKEFFEARGVAKSCDSGNAQDIARAVRWFLDHREQCEAMAETGRRLLRTEWNYETQFEKVLDQLDGV